MVTNFPSSTSSRTTPFAIRISSDGLGCSRASERNTNLVMAMSAAASIPLP